MGFDDYSYEQVYAVWQAELREQAATDALARRIRREQRAARSGEPGPAHRVRAAVHRVLHQRSTSRPKLQH